MRPLRLEIKGFTSFRDEQVVDFESLESPFAIVGPTGSGKSSILDAMTFALYGDVDRVEGSDTSMQELITHGQPSLAVQFDFEVGDDRYRVLRRLPRGGSTRIQVWRAAGDDWVQAGAGSDKVTTANRFLRELMGFDYDGFTRSVLLPQGKFSQFMEGKADQRRKILNELLELNRFVLMAQRAREIERDESRRAANIDETLSDQFASATPEALQAAKESEAAAAKRHDALIGAAEAVNEVAARWNSVNDAVLALRSCSNEAGEIAEAAAGHATTLRGLVTESAAADGALQEAEAAALTASKDADAAAMALADAEREWGTATDLATAAGHARTLANARADAAARARAVADAKAAVPDASKSVDAAEEEVGRARAAVTEASGALESAVAALREVEHADKVGDLVASLKVGDECPVCGEPLTAIPKRPGTAAIRDARRSEEAARRAEAEAREGATAAEKTLDRARSAVADAQREVERATKELERCEMTVTELATTVAEALGGGDLPDDPSAVIGERALRIEELTNADRKAAVGLQTAERTLAEAGNASERIAGRAREARAGLAARPVAPVAARAAAVDAELRGPEEAELPAADDLAELADASESRAAAIRAYAAVLAAAADERAASQPGLLAEASALVEGLVRPSETLPALLASVNTAVNDAIREHERSKAAVSGIEENLAKVADLRAQSQSARERARVFRALALELKADNLIAYLQIEALRLLAVGGSTRLAGLSGGRYELEYEDDEFLVVDKWNGDETRSVRTLSGGETFLASLALALALAEQVTSLAVNAQASLDSLFLDEGFGTLDPDTLEIVVQAIGELGGDGRIVGVITHVRDLADNMASRIEIEKTQRGSAVRQAG
jgi:exonuclease SbcC